MVTVEGAMDFIIDKANEYFANQPTNKYVHGFDVILKMDIKVADFLVEKFNSGDSGKLLITVIDGPEIHFSWAPTQHDLDHRENLR